MKYKTSLSLALFFIFLNAASAQIIEVKDVNGEALPFFTVTRNDSALTKIGDESGRISFSENDRNNLESWVIKYVGFKDKEFKLDSLLEGRNEIILEENIIQLETIEIKVLSDLEFAFKAKENLALMLNKLTIARAYLAEKEEDSFYESFGLFVQSGLIDRSKKSNQFHPGHLAFLPQYSQWANSATEFEPYQTSVSTITNFLNDAFLFILNSKPKDWRRVSEEHQKFEILTIAQSNLIFKFFPDGSLFEIEFQNQNFKNNIGIVSEIEGNINFASNSDFLYYSQFNFKVKSNNSLSEVSCIFDGLPSLVNFPESYNERNSRQRFFSTLGTYCRVPDYNVSPDFFDKMSFYRTPILASQKSKKLQPLVNSYKYYEVVDTSDTPSIEYNKNTSLYVNELFNIFMQYDLAW